jgi:hypothetical protein
LAALLCLLFVDESGDALNVNILGIGIGNVPIGDALNVRNDPLKYFVISGCLEVLKVLDFFEAGLEGIIYIIIYYYIINNIIINNIIINNIIINNNK